MSQVHNGEKTLLVTTPAVRVNDKISFVGELLQHISGSYFIPERFFTQDIPNHTGEDGKEIYSLGWEVARYEVCVSVHSHILLIRTLLDWVCCEWRTSHHQSQNFCTKLRGYREPSRRIEVRIFWYVFHLRRTLHALTAMNASKSTTRNAREGILCPLRHIFAPCLPDGVYASNEGIDNVSVGPSN
jgi:hypothetical protein